MVKAPPKERGDFPPGVFSPDPHMPPNLRATLKKGPQKIETLTQGGNLGKIKAQYITEKF